MTYEDFKKVVRIKYEMGSYDFCKIYVGVNFKIEHDIPSYMRVSNFEELMTQQLWAFLQSQVGHTDGEVMQAFREGCLRGSYQMLDKYDVDKNREPMEDGLVITVEGA